MSTASLMDRAISTWFKPVGIEDIIDKLNYLWTASLIGFFSLLVFTMQYGGSPIHCIVPSEHYFSMKQVVESYCYISSTYAVPLEKDIPRETSEREQTQINYFRWVPFMLLLQAFCFHIPSWLWNWLHDHSGIDLIFLTEDAKNLRGLMSEDRKALVKKLSNYMLERLGIGEQHLAPIRIFCFKGHHGSFMVVAYHIVKACYVVNAYLQLHCIKKFLGANDTFWATQMFFDVYNSKSLTHSGTFPRMILCDFNKRGVGNIHTNTYECILPLNHLNEKIFLILWLWIAFVFLVTMISFITSLVSITIPQLREKSTRQWIKKAIHKESGHGHENNDIIAAKTFCNKVLKPDGVLVLKIVECQAGGIVTNDLASAIRSSHPLDQWIRRLSRCQKEIINWMTRNIQV